MSQQLIYSRERNVLVYPSGALVEKLSGVLPLTDDRIAIPATLTNLQELTRIGQQVPPIMAYQYDWPRNKMVAPKPFRAQLITANFLALNPHAFVLSDMGTGKTLAALWAADFIMRQYPKGQCKCLIVAPLSGLRETWANSIFVHFLGKRTCVVLHGDAKRREKLLAQDHDFYIVNEDGLGVGARVQRKVDLQGFSKKLAEKQFQITIVDDCSYRDPGTRKHAVARHILCGVPYFWYMTGTPTPTSPVDAYGAAKLVNNAHGETLTSYRSRVMVQISPFKWVPREGANAMASKLLSPSVRFKISDCQDLPPCTTIRREAEFSAEQMKAYNELRRDCVLQLKRNKVLTTANEAALRWKLIQISCGALYDEDHETHFLDVSPRMKVLREVIEEANEKIIIFAPLTNVTNMIYKDLSRQYDCGLVEDYKQRSDMFRSFQTSTSPHILISHPQKMSHSLTLTAASTIVWFAPIDRNETYRQANKRIDRPGQVKNTRIVQIVSSPIEREIYRRLDANESMQGSILQLAEGN